MSRRARADARPVRAPTLVDSGSPSGRRRPRRWIESDGARQSKKRPGRPARRHGLGRALGAAGVPAGREPRPDVRPARSLALVARRADAGRPQGVLGRRAAGYLVVGRDLIPDDIPILGGLDDLVVVVLAVDLFLDGVPDGPARTRSSTSSASTASRSTSDIAQIRRLTPGPVRRTHPPGPGARRAAGGRHRSSRARAAGAGLDHQGGTHRVKVILTKDVPKLGKSGEMKRSPTATPRTSSSRRARRPGRRRRLPRLAARHREPRGQAQARARGGRDRRDPDRQRRR